MGSLPTSPLVRSVAVDPDTPERVYAAGPAGLFRSFNAGVIWVESGAELIGEPLAVALDPLSPETIFAVTTDSSVWQSLDGASTWRRIWPAGDTAP